MARRGITLLLVLALCATSALAQAADDPVAAAAPNVAAGKAAPNVAAAPEAAAPEAADIAATPEAVADAVPALEDEEPVAAPADGADALTPEAAPAAKQTIAEPDAAAPAAATKEATEANATAAAVAAAPKAHAPIVVSPRWTAMVDRIKGMQALCRDIGEKWRCNSGSQTCVWDEAQSPPCVVPEAYVKARLIEAVPCEGSLMEQWFACQAANNDKASCGLKSSCVWVAWSNYTNLPLPTAGAATGRKLLQAAAAEPTAEPAATNAAKEPVYEGQGDNGACQLAKVYKLRTSEEWDDLNTLTFQISHMDPAVWGECDTVSELKSLVPPATRLDCAVSRTPESCAVAAPMCAWRPLPVETARGRVAPGQKEWPTEGCQVTCDTADRALCLKYADECSWYAKTGRCGANNGTVADELLAAAAGGKPANLTGIAARVAARDECVAGSAKHGANVTCAADGALADAAFTLIQLARGVTDPEQLIGGGATTTNATDAAAAGAHAPKTVRSGAAGARIAAGAATTLAGAAAAVALLL